MVAALLVAGVDGLMLGLVVAFGPSGFGGDRTPTRSEQVRAAVGEAAGVAALVIGAAVVLGAVAGRLTPPRRRLLGATLAAQAAAAVVVVWSTLGGQGRGEPLRCGIQPSRCRCQWLA